MNIFKLSKSQGEKSQNLVKGCHCMLCDHTGLRIFIIITPPTCLKKANQQWNLVQKFNILEISNISKFNLYNSHIKY